MSSRRSRTAQELVRLAHHELYRENFGDAEAYGRRALMISPDSLPARHAVANAVIELGRFEEAAELLEQIVAADPDDLSALADLGSCLYEICEFDDAQGVLSRALEIEPDDAQANYWTALCLERHGRYREAETHFQLAHERDPDAYHLPLRMTRDEFDAVLEQAQQQLSEGTRREIKRLTIAVGDLPREADLLDYSPPLDPCIFGLFVGVPLREREPGATPSHPDVICLYQRNLERLCRDRAMMVREIAATLEYEVGIFVGRDEDASLASELA